MRVLAVSYCAPWLPAHGGSLILSHHLEELSARHDIALLCAASRSERRGPAPDGVDTEAFSPRVPAAVDYVGRRLRSVVSGEPPHVHWVARRALAKAISRHLQEQPPDLLYLFGWGTAQLWREAQGIPTVHFAVDPWFDNTVNRRLPRWRALVDSGVGAAVAAHERTHYPRLDRVVFVAAEDAEGMARSIGAAQVRTVPNGVDPGADPSAPPRDPVIGFHGSFDVEANVDAARVLLGELVPALRSRFHELRALVIGRDPPSELRQLAGPAITVTGRVPSVRPWLERCGVYVAPMVSGAGLKNKVLEAMAAGRPVVATPLGLQGIGPGPGVFEAATVSDMAEIVLGLFGDRAKLVEAGRRARARAIEEFSWAASAARLETVWAETVGMVAR